MTGDPAAEALASSVDRIGLLPRLMIGEDGVVDLSGLGGDQGAPLPKKQVGWAGAGTDEMWLTRTAGRLSGGQNRPRIVDVDADPSQYRAELLAGFTDAYDVIAAHRDDLVGARGLLWRFAEDEVRVLARATHTYAQLLDESTHPDVLRDALDRDRILDYLWAASAGDPALESLVRHEISDLWAGDVPIFSGRPSSAGVWTSAGTALSGVLTGPSLQRAAEKIRALSPADRERQEWVIQAAFAARATGVTITGSAGPASGRAAEEPDPDRLVAAARGIADELDRLGCSHGSQLSWLGLDLVEEKYWTLRPLGFDVFSGYPGVALFLAQLAAVTGDERYADLARRAAWPLPRVVEAMAGQPAALGGFNGPAGIGYVLVHLAALLGDPALAEPVQAAVERCRAAVADEGTPDPFDIVGGSAGTLAAMLAIHDATGLEAARRVAEACAQRLAARAVRTGEGVAWPSPAGDGVYLAGFSHGGAGIGWALMRYAAATGATRYATLAGAAFAHERGLYDPRLGDWRDLRRGTGRPPAAMHAWCNGAPGIGLARADILHRLAPRGALQLAVAGDFDLPVTAALTAGPLSNHSLCHGELGNLELLTAAAALGNAEAAAARAGRTAAALAEIERGDARCGTPGMVGTPGLLTGYAGIGHGLLRLAYPERVPAVLLLDAPSTRSPDAPSTPSLDAPSTGEEQA